MILQFQQENQLPALEGIHEMDKTLLIENLRAYLVQKSYVVVLMMSGASIFRMISRFPYLTIIKGVEL